MCSMLDITICMLWYQLLWTDDPHDHSLGSTTEATQRSTNNEKKKRRRYFKYRKSTHNLLWFYRSNRSCVRPREKGEKIY